MNDQEFEQFVNAYGNDILSFCKMQTMDAELGRELYQETMLKKLLEKKRKLNLLQSGNSYAISVAILLLKNNKKTYAKRRNIVGFHSLETIIEEVGEVFVDSSLLSPEEGLVKWEEVQQTRKLVNKLPEKLRMPVILFYPSNMKIDEIADCLQENPNTIKTRLRRAKDILKDEMEGFIYDR